MDIVASYAEFTMKKELNTIFKLCCIALTLAGCAGSPAGKLVGNVEDSKTKALLKRMIGHPLSELVAQIGAPQSSVQDMLATEKTYMHTWTTQKYARDKFVKTGTVYAGTTRSLEQISQDGTMAEVYRNQYEDVGYNTPTYYTCLLQVFTDAQGIIIAQGGNGQKTQPTGSFCDKFLKLK